MYVALFFGQKPTHFCYLQRKLQHMYRIVSEMDRYTMLQFCSFHWEKLIIRARDGRCSFYSRFAERFTATVIGTFPPIPFALCSFICIFVGEII